MGNLPLEQVRCMRTLGLLTFLKDWRLVYLEEDAASATCQQALERLGISMLLLHLPPLPLLLFTSCSSCSFSSSFLFCYL